MVLPICGGGAVGARGPASWASGLVLYLCKDACRGTLNVLVNRLLGQVRRRFGRRTAVRRPSLWRPGPRIRIEFGTGGQAATVSVTATVHQGLTVLAMVFWGDTRTRGPSRRPG